MKKKFLAGQWVIMVCAIVALTGCETMKETTSNWDLDHEYSKSMDLRETYENTGAITSTRLKNPEGTGEIVASKPREQKTGYNTATIAYPTGRRDSSSLLITKTVPKLVRKGKAYEYMIEVTNLTNLNLQDVNLSEILPRGFQLASATPQGKKSGDSLNWDFGQLKPGEKRAITLTGKTNTGDLPCCTSATYEAPALCLSTAIVEPGLAVAVKVPSTKIICDTIPVEYTVENTGDSYLNDVVVTSKLPSGITTTNGQSSVTIKAGGLAEGQTRTFTKMVKASKTGSYSFRASAEDNSDISASSSADSISVTQPAISVSAKANRSKQYVGRNVGYTVTARNTGATATTDTVVTASIPSGSKFASASNSGNASGGQVRWNIGTLAAGASKTLSFEVVAGRAGEIQTNAQAKAYCCEDTDLAKANIEGIPALLLEVVDVADPIEMGEEQTYVITITNQGTADANNVSIAAELEGMSYVSVSGASTGSASGNMVTLRAIPRIPAKDKITWRVTAKTTQAGDRRFKVKMNSDELGRSVDETESTFVY